LKYFIKSLSKPNGSKRKPEPELTEVQVPGSQKDVFGPSQFFTSRLEHSMKKTKRFGSTQKWGFERRGEGSSGIQSQDDQELTAATVAVSLITENSSEHQILDVTNKVMVNRYLRVFTMFYTAW